MSDLGDLYQEMILDHGRHPRNVGELDPCDAQAEGHNPLCGDRLRVFLNVQGDCIKEVRFRGSGCAISTASASLMTESIKGRTVAEAQEIFHHFHRLVTGQPPEGQPELGKLEVFSGVSEFPVRVKCATLAWHTLQAALDHRTDPVTTE